MALALCEQIGEDRLATWLDPIVAVIAADLGDDDAARTHAERAWERARQLNQLMLSAWALNALGYAAMQRGDLPGALAWYEQYVALVRDTENGVVRSIIMARAAEAFLLAGRVEDAAQLAEKAIAVTESAKAPHYAALARRVQAQVFAARGDHAAALRAFTEVIASFTQLGSRLELARTVYLRAALLLDRGESGEREAARADLVSARDNFVAMGAAHDRRRVEELLRE